MFYPSFCSYHLVDQSLEKVKQSISNPRLEGNLWLEKSSYLSSKESSLALSKPLEIGLEKVHNSTRY